MGSEMCIRDRFTPVAQNRAISSIDSISSRGTGVGKKARMLRREAIAQSTVWLSSSDDIGGLDKRFIFIPSIPRIQLQADVY